MSVFILSDVSVMGAVCCAFSSGCKAKYRASYLPVAGRGDMQPLPVVRLARLKVKTNIGNIDGRSSHPLRAATKI
jgi:hypothetical protein